MATATERVISTKAHVLLKYLIQYHLEGDIVFAYLLRETKKGDTEADEALTATKRFKVILRALAGKKKVCYDIAKDQGIGQIISTVVRPLTFVKIKATWRKNDGRRSNN
ncbi:hypothetical protein DOTSEDRAFT_55742 [Dothistroma septosporum NZE10]|uniref:Uncharacterized protein n=1 Tax=Dothistroma septosporum (strain NZE10 / CBS 128990) TaxID=675120 RepID=N1PDX2_DOTSN|nr:hypothetical protein DOTSEDRAFT_55742 [Dothistroma septosporum NZE10]